ncbi:MAG: type II toxin-antitoxin system YafQ family toxin [Patescibacteria group bacterium]
MSYTIRRSNKFKRQYRKLQRSGNIKLVKELDCIIVLLAGGEILPLKNNNHRLMGNLRFLYECHIASNWLLVYCYDHEILSLELIATGSHSDLF